ncbi:MAG TPA: type II toxin-antitoxin system PrlF family antitoxin [Gammaproteobacteria bacterium]|jgi:antitoxin PrlF|nr:type II toxin-antitoxin system PrlF family antitoxin [Gammaproteobacteria bacterium]
MVKVLHSRSTLTDRYQTTVPEMVRNALQLGKRDKIEYELSDDGKVTIHRAEEDDPVLSQFLLFIISDIQKHPEHIKPINVELYLRAKALVSDVEIDLNAQLPDDKDE